MATTYERLKKIVVEQLGADEDEVKPEASFVDDLNADSLDLVAVFDDGRDQLAGQRGGGLVALRLGEMTLQDGLGGALPEVGLEHGREGEPATGPPAADAVSPRRHRPAR